MILLTDFTRTGVMYVYVCMSVQVILMMHRLCATDVGGWVESSEDKMEMQQNEGMDGG